MIERLRVRVRAGTAGEFSSPEFTFCADFIRCPFHPRVITVTRKRPRSFCQKRRWQVTPKHAYPLTQRSRSGLSMPSRPSVGTFQGNESTGNSSVNTRLQSSQLDDPLWSDPGLRSGLSAQADLYMKKKKKQNRRRGSNHLNFPRKSSQAKKEAIIKKPSLCLGSRTRRVSLI